MFKSIVFAVLLMLVFASTSFAGPSWGQQCERYFRSVDRFCEVAQQAPAYAPACKPIQDAIADMKKLAQTTDPAVMESACEQGAMAMEQLIVTLQPAVQAPAQLVFGEQCETYVSVIEEFCEQPIREFAAMCEQQLSGIRRMRENTPADLSPDAVAAMESECAAAVDAFRASITK
ncbi:MAG: hypothetical protein AUK47_14820 [Deltaproteobacteria bacterium CG2_30_63_29]|nr:MAG: hypothetical protein AUK47_14820 [Deltaproteobacteria bacterium CG2_30_63_29]